MICLFEPSAILSRCVADVGSASGDAGRWHTRRRMNVHIAAPNGARAVSCELRVPPCRGSARTRIGVVRRDRERAPSVHRGRGGVSLGLARGGGSHTATQRGGGGEESYTACRPVASPALRATLPLSRRPDSA
eukprot:4013260-Prymnesium_polylepis.2